MARSFRQILSEKLNDGDLSKLETYIKNNKESDLGKMKEICNNFSSENDFTNWFKGLITGESKIEGKITDELTIVLHLNNIKEDKNHNWKVKLFSEGKSNCLYNFITWLSSDYKFSNSAANVLKTVEFTKKMEGPLKELSKNDGSKMKFDSQTCISEWEKFGKVVTYNSIEMLNFAANSKTKIDNNVFQECMKKTFRGKSTTYRKQFENFDQKLDWDATLMVIEELANDGDLEETDLDKVEKESYFQNYVNNMLNESMDSSEAQNIINGLKEKGNDAVNFASGWAYSSKKQDQMKKLIEAVKTLYKDDFIKCRNELEAAFDKGRLEIIEDEKKDTEDFHVDPANNQQERKKRVGRLGKHGPMTFIKNHEDLNNAVEAIDKQPWNIFNCGAKLMIKLFKLIEHGSKKWQEFKQKWDLDFKKFKDGLNNKKEKDFIEDIKNAQSAEQAITLGTIAFAKYENIAIGSFNTSLFVEKKDAPGVFIIDKEVAKKLINNMGLLKETENILEALMLKLDEFEKQPEQQKDESKNESYIVEADDMAKKTSDEINNAAAEGKAEAEKDAKNQKKEAKPEEKSKEEKENEANNKNWSKTKFEVDFSGLDSLFTNIDLYVNNTDFINNGNKIFNTIIEKNQELKEPLEPVMEIYNLLSAEKEGHYLSSDEIQLKEIVAGEFVARWQNLLNAIKNINYKDIPNISDEELEKVEIKQDDVSDVKGEVPLLDYDKLGTDDPQKNSNDNSGELNQLTQDIVKDVKGTNRKNYKAAIDDIKKKKEEVLSIMTSTIQKIDPVNFDNVKKLKGDGKINGTQLKLFFHPDGLETLKNQHIIPIIWYANCYNSNINTWINDYGVGKLKESVNDEIQKGIEVAFKNIDACIPADLSSDVYKQTEDKWTNGPYAEFKKTIAGLVAIVEKNKESIKEESLKEIGVESVDKYLEFLKNDKNDPLLQLEYILAFFVNDSEENSQEGDKPSEEVQNQILQIGHEVQQSTALIANMNKQMKFDRSAYEKLVNQFKTEKEQNEKIFKANDFFSDKNKVAKYWNYLNADFKEDNGSIVCKIHLMNRILQNVATGKFGLKKENFDEVFDPLLVEEYNENDVKARIKTANDFIAKFCITPDNYTDPKWEALYYKLSLKDFSAQYGKDFVENVKAIYEQVKEVYESNKDNYEEEVQKIMEGGPGNFDLYIILLACEQIVANKGENKEEKPEGETSEEGSQEGTQEEKSENESIKFENPFNLKLFNECYKYIRG